MLSRDEALSLVRTYGRAWETRDPELVATIFTDDASYDDPKEPLNVGLDAIRRYWISKVIGEQDRIKFELLHLWLDEREQQLRRVRCWLGRRGARPPWRVERTTDTRAAQTDGDRRVARHVHRHKATLSRRSARGRHFLCPRAQVLCFARVLQSHQNLGDGAIGVLAWLQSGWLIDFGSSTDASACRRTRARTTTSEQTSSASACANTERSFNRISSLARWLAEFSR